MMTHTYQLNTGMRCVKYMLLVINFMFMLTAILLVLVGTTIQAIFGDFKQFIDDHFLSPPTLLVAVGCIMLLVSSFGCFGAIKESTMLINIYGLFLFLIFLLEISSSIAAFMLQGEVGTMLIRTMNNSFNDYEKNKYIEKSVDFMQGALECCGTYGPADWKNILEVNKNSISENDAIVVPPSCCERYSNNNTMEKIECVSYYDTGCLDKLAMLISSSAMLVATGAITVAFVQLLGVFCAFMLAKTIRRNKSIRQARIWQLQQSLGILATGGKNLQDSGYTQLNKSDIEKHNEPVIYTASSPSVN